MQFNKEKLGLILLFILTAGPLVALPFIPSNVSPKVQAVLDAPPESDLENKEIDKEIAKKTSNIIEEEKKQEDQNAIVIGDAKGPEWGLDVDYKQPANRRSKIG